MMARTQVPRGDVLQHVCALYIFVSAHMCRNMQVVEGKCSDLIELVFICASGSLWGGVVAALRVTDCARRAKYNKEEELGQSVTHTLTVLPCQRTETNGCNKTAGWKTEFCWMRAKGNMVDLCLPSTGSQFVLLTGQQQTDGCVAQLPPSF